MRPDSSANYSLFGGKQNKQSRVAPRKSAATSIKPPASKTLPKAAAKHAAESKPVVKSKAAPKRKHTTSKKKVDGKIKISSTWSPDHQKSMLGLYVNSHGKKLRK